MLRRQKHVVSQSTTPFACTLVAFWASKFSDLFGILRLHSAFSVGLVSAKYDCIRHF